MAMMTRSLAPLLLVLSISFMFTAEHATRSSTAAAAGDDFKKACSMTTFSGPCIKMLESTPEIQTASPRQVALTAFKYLVKEGEPLVVESQREVAGCKDDAIKACLTALDANLRSHVEPLSKLAPEQSDARFGEARDELNRMLSIPSNDGEMCMGNAISGNPVITRIFKYEEMLQITGDLMQYAQPAPAPPQ